MLLLSLEYLHSKGVVHRDFKPSNIFMESYPTGLTILKAGDFGLSKMDLEQLKRKMTETFGLQTTAAYMAPEVLNDNYPTHKIDIWAAGVIFYEMISALKHPF
jgi:serine/threonine protein kinase